MSANPINAFRQDLVSQIETHKAAVTKLETTLAKLDRAFPDAEQPTTTPRRKPGPKPGTKRNVKVASPKRTAKNKPGPKPRQVKAAPKTTPRKVKNTRAVDGRRAIAQGLRPSIKTAIAVVMNNDTLGATEIYERLKARDWLPNANEPRMYITHTLSKNKDVFDRTNKRGVYVLSDKGKALVAAHNGNTTAPSTEPVANETDKTLVEEGFIPQAAPAN